MADVAHSTTNITGGHANAVAAGAAGFLSGTDKTAIDNLAAQKTGTFPIVSTAFASGTTQPTTITDAAMAGITGVSTAGGKTGTGATDGTLGVVAGSFASSGAETGTGGTQGGLGSAAGANQPYNTTDFPGGRYTGVFTKNGKDVLLAQMLSTALTDLDAVVTPFFAFRSDAAADSKWRVWWYYTRSSDGLLVPFTPTTSVTGQLNCPQVALTTTLPASAGFTNEAAGAGVNQLPAGLVGDLQTLGTAAIGTTGRYADAAHVHPPGYVDVGTIVVQACTTAALPAYTKSGSGSTTTLTANANGAFPTLDGYATLTAAAAGEPVTARFLHHHGSADNGVFVLTAQGDGSTAWVAKIYSGLVTAADVNGSKIRVRLGLQNGGADYEYRAVAAFVLGTTLAYWWRTDGNAGPNQLVKVIDTDFQHGVLTTTNNTLVADCLAQFNTGTGTPGGQILASSGTATRSGVLSISTGTGAAGRGALINSIQAAPFVIGTDVGIFMEYKGGKPTLSDGTNTFGTVFGLSDTATALPGSASNTIAITTQPAVGANLLVTTAAGSAVTNTDTGRTVVAGTDDHIIVRKDPGDNSIYAWTNGGATQTITTNVPTTVAMGLVMMALKSLGATNRTEEIDIARLHIYWPKGRAA